MEGSQAVPKERIPESFAAVSTNTRTLSSGLAGAEEIGHFAVHVPWRGGAIKKQLPGKRLPSGKTRIPIRIRLVDYCLCLFFC